MSAPEDRISKDTRRFGAWKEFLNVALRVAVLVLCGFAIWGIVQYNSREEDRQRDIWTPLKETVANFKETSENVKTVTKNAADGTAQIAPLLKAYQGDADELKKTIATLNTQSAQIGSSVQARMLTLDGLLMSVRGASDEGARQLKQLGDATTRGINAITDFTNHRDTEVSKLLSDGSLLVQTTNSKLTKLFDDFDVIAVGTPDKEDESLKGAVKKANVALDGLGKTSNSLALIASDLREKERSILFPPPVKGFWPRVKQVGLYVLRPVFDGVRFYYQIKNLNELPVRITQPIPQK